MDPEKPGFRPRKIYIIYIRFWKGIILTSVPGYKNVFNYGFDLKKEYADTGLEKWDLERIENW